MVLIWRKRRDLNYTPYALESLWLSEALLLCKSEICVRGAIGARLTRASTDSRSLDYLRLSARSEAPLRDQKKRIDQTVYPLFLANNPNFDTKSFRKSYVSYALSFCINASQHGILHCCKQAFNPLSDVTTVILFLSSINSLAVAAIIASIEPKL